MAYSKGMVRECNIAGIEKIFTSEILKGLNDLYQFGMLRSSKIHQTCHSPRKENRKDRSILRYKTKSCFHDIRIVLKTFRKSITILKMFTRGRK